MRSTARWRALVVLLFLSGAAFGPHRAMAQAYPTRPITMIVPFAAGGSTDSVARIVADAVEGVPDPVLEVLGSDRFAADRLVPEPQLV